MDARDADGTAAGRRLAEALRAQASFTSGPAPAPPQAASPRPMDNRFGAPQRPRPAGQNQGPHARFVAGASGALPTVAGPQARAGTPPASSVVANRGWWSGPSEVSARVRLALLAALLVGLVLGCALGVLSVLLPGLFPALG